jgi:hypothetical protein
MSFYGKERINMNIKLVVFTVLLTTVFASSALGQDSTVVVLGNTTAVENTPGGWMFNRDPRTATAYEFNNDEASIGYGSLYAGPITNSNFNGIPGNNPNWDKFIGENFVRTAIADVNGISFDFLMGTGANPNQYYMNVYTTFGVSSPTKFYDCRYDVVATIGSNSVWTTVAFDPTLIYTVATRAGAEASPFPCPASPSAMDGLSAGSQIRAININLGDTSASDAGYSGYFDNVVVDRASGKTTYDFEPYLVATNKDECKNGGWQTYRRANGTTFRNQGDCVSYVNTGR